MGFVKTEKATDFVKIEMENGDAMVIELDNEDTPVTKSNFQKLVSEKFFDGLIFHRVIEGFMIQGGDPTGTGCGGSEQTIKGEFSSNGVDNKMSHLRGVISMARTNMPNSASSQFFICHKDAKFLDGQYACFGRVVEGMDTVDKIAATATSHNDRPVADQTMSSVYFVEKL